ncbi:GNAT family N-acetyltransferase [Defluviitalea phaphyphila]|uniref:GNAT family N-acetyltransferase n=1 Tax=Defluviitalea phaphyphila TaxID=1473580 RepID=UPI000731A98C|nr:GNAT family N-acetyltransferase [Defluviitalea phaphyphila]
MDITIRKAEDRDIEAMMDIYNYYVLNTCVTFDLEKKDIQNRKKWFETHNENYPIIIAEYKNKVVGYACLSSFRPLYNNTVENSIYIHRDYKNIGVGSLLMKELIKIASKLNYHVIVAVIEQDNEESIKFHEKFGFKYMGSLKEVGYKFNQWRNVVFYQLTL